MAIWLVRPQWTTHHTQRAVARFDGYHSFDCQCVFHSAEANLRLMGRYQRSLQWPIGRKKVGILESCRGHIDVFANLSSNWCWQCFSYERRRAGCFIPNWFEEVASTPDANVNCFDFYSTTQVRRWWSKVLNTLLPCTQCVTLLHTICTQCATLCTYLAHILLTSCTQHTPGPESTKKTIPHLQCY